MSKKKLTLEDLNIQSFSTSLNLDEKRNVAGNSDIGASQTNCGCGPSEYPGCMWTSPRDCSEPTWYDTCQTEAAGSSCVPSNCYTTDGTSGCQPTYNGSSTCDGTATCTPGQGGC